MSCDSIVSRRYSLIILVTALAILVQSAPITVGLFRLFQIVVLRVKCPRGVWRRTCSYGSRRVNFVVCQLLAVLLGYPFRLLFGPHLVSPTLRHIVEITVGLLFAYFCFGNQMLHLVLQSSMCLVVIWTVPPESIGTMVLAVAMGHLSICHLSRMIYDYGGYTLDITGPMMVSTQRLTSLAFGLEDGLKSGYRNDYTDLMKKHIIESQPSFLEFFSYIFCFHGLLCGPFCFYSDYIAFIDGTNYVPPQVASALSNDDFGQSVGPRLDLPPAPGEHLAVKLLLAGAFGLSAAFVLPFFPVDYLTSVEFSKSDFPMKILITILWPIIHRHKYYAAWKLGESANVSCGLGFSGYNSNGSSRWNLMDNIDIERVELATSPKMFLDNWNITTMKWLRYVVYDRWRNMAAVLFFSAAWHGFYGGYYLAAITIILILLAARKLRRFIQPGGCCDAGSPFETVYNVITFIATSLSIPYAACAFMILSFGPGFVFYSQVYFWMHVLCVVLIILL